MSWQVLTGDCRTLLATLPDKTFNTCVTSPPYFGLRDYKQDAQIGLEKTAEGFIAEMVAVFQGVRRVLRDDGTLWLNLGDSYAGSRAGPQGALGEMSNRSIASQREMRRGADGKHEARARTAKQLLGIPWRVALALQADGWYLRQDIIWAKPNPMPESVRDRCTKSHEYLFLLSKSPQYYFDNDAIAEPLAAASVARLAQSNLENQAGSTRVPGKTNGAMKAVGKRSARDNFKREGSKRAEAPPGQSVGTHRPDRADSEYDLQTRNRRSVWTVATQPFKEAHFATYPPKLIEPCILAGAPVGGRVLDPFGGAGTTALVAERLGRRCVLIELNPDYVSIAVKRLIGDLL